MKPMSKCTRYSSAHTLRVYPYLPISLRRQRGWSWRCLDPDPISRAKRIDTLLLARQKHEHAVAFVKREPEPAKHTANPSVSDGAFIVHTMDGDEGCSDL